jgi:hypothetical protein
MCKNAIEKGIEADNSNPEAYQSMASFLLVKQDKEVSAQGCDWIYLHH